MEKREGGCLMGLKEGQTHVQVWIHQNIILILIKSISDKHGAQLISFRVANPRLRVIIRQAGVLAIFDIFKYKYGELCDQKQSDLKSRQNQFPISKRSRTEIWCTQLSSDMSGRCLVDPIIDYNMGLGKVILSVSYCLTLFIPYINFSFFKMLTDASSPFLGLLDIFDSIASLMLYLFGFLLYFYDDEEFSTVTKCFLVNSLAQIFFCINRLVNMQDPPVIALIATCVNIVLIVVLDFKVIVKRWDDGNQDSRQRNIETIKQIEELQKQNFQLIRPPSLRESILVTDGQEE